MSTDQPDPRPLDRALRRAHLSVLGTLLLCGLVIASGGFEGDEPPPSPTLATLGIALGIAAIVTRQLGTSPKLGAKARLLFSLASLALAVGLGLLGVFMAFGLDAPESGILFTLAGLIFSARPLAPLQSR